MWNSNADSKPSSGLKQESIIIPCASGYYRNEHINTNLQFALELELVSELLVWKHNRHFLTNQNWEFNSIVAFVNPVHHYHNVSIDLCLFHLTADALYAVYNHEWEMERILIASPLGEALMNLIRHSARSDSILVWCVFAFCVYKVRDVLIQSGVFFLFVLY